MDKDDEDAECLFCTGLYPEHGATHDMLSLGS
jgi:hypothetical protein